MNIDVDKLIVALQNHMERSRCSITEAVRQIGVSKSTLYRLERKQVQPSRETIEAICNWIGKPIDEFSRGSMPIDMWRASIENRLKNLEATRSCLALSGDTKTYVLECGSYIGAWGPMDIKIPSGVRFNLSINGDKRDVYAELSRPSWAK